MPSMASMAKPGANAAGNADDDAPLELAPITPGPSEHGAGGGNRGAAGEGGGGAGSGMKVCRVCEHPLAPTDMVCPKCDFATDALVGKKVRSIRDESAVTNVEMKCPNCGYDCRGLTKPRCPECGERVTFAQLKREAKARQSKKLEYKLYIVPAWMAGVGLFILIVMALALAGSNLFQGASQAQMLLGVGLLLAIVTSGTFLGYLFSVLVWAGEDLPLGVAAARVGALSVMLTVAIAAVLLVPVPGGLFAFALLTATIVLVSTGLQVKMMDRELSEAALISAIMAVWIVACWGAARTVLG